MIAYINVPLKDIQILTRVTAPLELTHTKLKIPIDVVNVEIAIASFLPMCFSRRAPTREPGRPAMVYTQYSCND